MIKRKTAVFKMLNGFLSDTTLCLYVNKIDSQFILNFYSNCSVFCMHNSTIDYYVEPHGEEEEKNRMSDYLCKKEREMSPWPHFTCALSLWIVGYHFVCNVFCNNVIFNKSVRMSFILLAPICTGNLCVRYCFIIPFQ